MAAWLPGTDQLVRLFNPRIDAWHDHFEWNGAELLGHSDIAQVTIAILQINSETRLSHRRLLIESGLFPPGH